MRCGDYFKQVLRGTRRSGNDVDAVHLLRREHSTHTSEAIGHANRLPLSHSMNEEIRTMRAGYQGMRSAAAYYSNISSPKKSGR